MSDGMEREFRRFLATIEAQMRTMEEAVRRHDESLEEAIREHQDAMERARDEFERRIASFGLGPHRRRGRRRRPGPDLDLGGVPVKPNNPKGMSGGAAVELDASD